MKKLLIAAIMVVLATPAFAAIQNVKVSGSIITSWVDLNQFDLGMNLGEAGQSDFALPLGQNPPAYGVKKSNLFVTQTELNVNADLSDNVSTTVGLINERAWNAENSVSSNNYANDTDVQLYLASITLREFLYSPLTLQIGRQIFNFGNGLVMGNGGPINQASGNLGYIDQSLTERTAYDGVTATLDYKPLTISLIYFKNDQNILNGSPLEDKSSSDVYGYNANYQLSDPWSTVVEQYLFTRFNGTESFQGTLDTDVVGPNDKGNTLFVPGLRASTNPTKSLNVQGEVAWQLGQQVVSNTFASEAVGQEAEHRNAMAAQVLATYSLPVLEKYKPSVNASFTYASGDKDGGDNQNNVPFKSAKVYTAWDEFNTIQGAGTIYRSLFNFSDEDILALGASIAPLEDVTAAVTWSGLWAPQSYTYGNSANPLSMYQPDSAGALELNPATDKGKHSLGNETDVNLTYNYTEDVTFGLSVGWFVPGNVFAKDNRDTASQAIANVAVNF